MNENELAAKICDGMLQQKRKNVQPLCILIGGLPGSGKTNLVEKLKSEYSDRDFVVIDADFYRKLHPNYSELIKTPEKAVVETCNFSNLIEAELIRKSIESHYDIISVTSLRATDAINEIVYEPAIQAGYKLESHIMSVPIRESALSAQNRYERQISEGDFPRFTPVSFIESSLGGIRSTVQLLERKEDKPVIKIYNRGNGEKSDPVEVYNSQSPNQIYSSVIDALLNPMKMVGEKEAEIQLNQLYELKRTRNASEIEYSSLQRIGELFEIEIEKEK